MTTTVIDKDALKQKYAEERAKRLRPDGNEQYIELKDQWSSYLEDPHLPVQPREAQDRSRHVRVCRRGIRRDLSPVRG